MISKLPFWSVPVSLLTFHNAIVEAVQQHQKFSAANSQQKRYLQVLGTKVSLLVILFEFFISGNYEFFQIALLQVCTRTSQHNFV